MGIALAEALKSVDLEAGRTYRCQVKGQTVEVGVLPLQSAWSGPNENGTPDGNVTVRQIDQLLPMKPFEITEDDLAPIDPWIELPAPKGRTMVSCHRGEPDPPDIPYIPNA